MLRRDGPWRQSSACRIMLSCDHPPGRKVSGALFLAARRTLDKSRAPSYYSVLLNIGASMSALRASYTIAPEVLRKFNKLVPAGERSQVIEGLMKRALVERRRQFEALAEEFETNPDFADDGLLMTSLLARGSRKPA